MGNMKDEEIQLILTVGTIGLKQSQFKNPDDLKRMERVVSKGWLFVNKQGEYKLTLKGQSQFKKLRREYEVEIGDLRTGQTTDVSIDELADIAGKKKWWEVE